MKSDKPNSRLYRIRNSIMLSVCCIISGSLPAEDILPAFECLIEPEMIIDVHGSAPGVYESIFVDVSDTITKDQALAQLESSVQEAAVAVSRARADQEDEIELKKTRLKFARRKLDRINELHKQQSISPSEKDEAETDVVLAELEVRNAINKRQLALLELEQAERRLAQRTLHSPIDGIVVERFISPGESADDKPVMRLAMVDPLRVELIIPVEYFGDIRIGMKAKITPEIQDLGTYNATVTVVDKLVDAPSGTFRVRMSLPNEDQQLPGGLKCTAEFIAAAHR